MASVAAPASVVREFTRASDVVVAGLNGPRQTVIGGPIDALHNVIARCRDAGYAVNPLHVSHAFHSPAMSSAAGAFAEFLAKHRFAGPRGRVISTVTAEALESDANLHAVLEQQISSPVRFDEAMSRIEDDVDLFIETGPGAVLTGLVASRGRTPVVALDAGADSVRGLLNAVGAAFAIGADVRWTPLTAGRFARRFDFTKRPSVLLNPCEADRAPTVSKRVAISRPRSIAASPSGDLRPGPANRDSGEALDLARAIVARRLELPESSVDPRHRLLSDLHLNSITATQVIVELAQALAVTPPRNPTDFADASIETLSQALLNGNTGRRVVAEVAPTGVAAWARTFATTWVEEPRAGDGRRPPARTVVLGADDDPIVIALREATRDAGPGGTIVCLPDPIRTVDVVDLLRAARRALAHAGPFTVVQRSAGAGAAARSMWLEAPHLDVLVATVDGDDEATLAKVLEEARCAKGFVEVQFRGGRRFVPYLAPTDWEPAAALPPGAGDVVLVTGGGRGITAECALELAKRCGARIGILGRAAPDADPDLARNLVRLAAHGAAVEYRSCDVTDAAAVQATVRDLERALGPITSVLHGAAINEPRLLAALDDQTAAVTVATKVDGLRNVLESVEPGRLRLCIAFGSLTARTGMRGDSHYAAANELMLAALDQWALGHPECRCLGIEWSVWAGTGMGERLGRLADLERDGITPLTIDQGTAAFCGLVSSRATGSVVVTGRFPQGQTLRLAGGDPPLLRFLEKTVVWYPGLEIVADAELTRSTDPYLDDHVIQGERVLPGVVGLEAMAQAAAALMRPGTALDVELADVAFDRPIVVPAAGTRCVRVAALRRGEWVEAVVRSDETQFAVDHFRARCRFVALEDRDVDADDRLGIQPVDAAALYAELLFQRGRFRRVAAYRDLHATTCEALLERSSPAPRWFDAFLPGDLVLGDPGAHDAALHAIQACVPESRLLPTAIERIRLRRAACPRSVRAVERAHEGRTFTYDLLALDQDGSICGEWTGARFTEVSATTLRSGWTEQLLGPAIERAAAALSNGATVRAFVVRSASPSPSGRGVMAERLGVLERRPDGRPEIAGADGTHVSIAHDDQLVLAVTASADAVGCDLQTCDSRPADEWARLLGSEGMQLAQFLSADTEPFDIAATRVWCARECLTKAGLSRDTRVAHARTAGGWSMLSADGAHVLTRAFTLFPDRPPVMVAVLLGCAASARATSLSGAAL
jgi:enediyne polyketide synthase